MYLEKISRARLAVGLNFVIPGANLLVEKLPDEELKTSSGIIKTISNDVGALAGDRLVKVKVVAIGEGFIDKDGSDIPNDSELGDILFVARHSVKWLTDFPVEAYETATLGLMSEEATQIRFRGEEALKSFKQATYDQGSTEATKVPTEDGGST